MCSYCGKKGHGKSAPARIHKTACSAYGHTCSLCNRDHHIEHVCRSKDIPKSNENDTYYGRVIIDTLCSAHDSLPNINCTVSNSGFERSICIDHHVYIKLSDAWVKQHSKLQPFFNVTTKVTKEDYAALGFHLERDTKTASLPAMADTGCQSCLAGLKVLHQLGLR